jgi:ADP-heptose:LPS heptosyltransferase
MHLLKLPEGISEPIAVYGGQSLEAGKQYLCANRFVGQMFDTEWRVIVDGEMWAARMLIEAEPWHEEAFDPKRNYSDIWIYRGGGWGDLLMLTPTLMELHNLYPKTKLHLSCDKGFYDLFHGLNYLHMALEHLPISWPLKNPDTSIVVTYEEIIEGDPSAERTHISQLFANKFGIKLSNLKPQYHVSDKELSWVRSAYPHIGKKRIGIQFLASGLYRSHPSMGSVVKELAKEHEVFLFGSPGQLTLKDPMDNVTNLMDDGLSFRESAAVLSTCDVCVAPDSALVHLSSALDIPCVALYGPFPADLRISHPKAVALQGHAECAPCFFHARSSTDFPAGMPCTKKGRCIAMESIPVEDIVKATIDIIS